MFRNNQMPKNVQIFCNNPNKKCQHCFENLVITEPFLTYKEKFSVKNDLRKHTRR